MKRPNLFTYQLLLIVFPVLMFSCQPDKVKPTSRNELTYPVVVNGKSYSKNQIEQIYSKIGMLELSKEEKVVIKTIGKNVFSLNKNIIEKTSNEIVSGMQKLTTRRKRTAYYLEVKRGLKEILPEEEFNTLISNINAKLDSVFPNTLRSLTPSQRIKYFDSLKKNF